MRFRAFLFCAPLVSALSLGVGCGETSEAQAIAWANADLNLSLKPAQTSIIDLRWRAPTSCTQVYRISIDDEYPQSIVRAFGSEAEKSVSTLALALDPYAKTKTKISGDRLSAPPLGADELWQGRLLFFGPKSEDRLLERELFFSGRTVGLGSPDAACFERTWDPIEDALALGWPTLPGRLTALGEEWRGSRVESRCNRSACADPITGNGGADAHHLTCTTMAWRETLEGIYEQDGHRIASITGFWSDGHALDQGIWSERQSLISSDDGRLLAAEILIHHNRYKITRHLRIEAVDNCPGGLPALGGAATPPPEGAAGAAAGIQTDIARALAGLNSRKPG
ncbi:MAG TPA: hypothetical protein ENJ18_05575 [Nannocystis exedens]|nr:hypothetical protein [Nannocystis exedens]